MELRVLCLSLLFEISELSYLLRIPAKLQSEGGGPKLLQAGAMAKVMDIFRLYMSDP